MRAASTWRSLGIRQFSLTSVTEAVLTLSESQVLAAWDFWLQKVILTVSGSMVAMKNRG